MNLRLMTTSLALLGVPALALAWLSLTPLAIHGVEVAAGTCDTSPAAQATTTTRWNGALLELAVDQSQNCAASLDEASVQRVGSHLFVRTRYQAPSDVATGCNCQHRTNLRVPGLPQRDYTVHVYSWP